MTSWIGKKRSRCDSGPSGAYEFGVTFIVGGSVDPGDSVEGALVTELKRPRVKLAVRCCAAP